MDLSEFNSFSLSNPLFVGAIVVFLVIGAVVVYWWLHGSGKI